MVQQITVIAEHSVCLDLLPERAVILDAGCRGFDFADYFRKRGHLVVAIDIDDLQGDYLKVGLSSASGYAKISKDIDPQARHLVEVVHRQTPFRPEIGEVELTTIVALQRYIGINGFDLIKLDIEGEEVAVLENCLHPIAKQISVEFHAHCTLQTRAKIDSLLDQLSEWYTIHNRVWESRHGAGFNYWDILLIAK